MHDTDRREDHAFRLIQLAEGFGAARAVQLAAELGVADLLAGEPRGAADLAAAVPAHPDALYRLLRALASVGVFVEVEPGWFGLTPVGERLRTDHPQSLRSWVIFQGLLNTVYANAADSIRTGTATTAKIFGEPLFEHLRSHPEHRALFNAAMAEQSRVTGETLAHYYDFSRARQIVDVGGGNGAFLSAVLRANPELTGVVYDQPYLADDVERQLAATGLADRCGFLPGDFLDSVPAGADLYLMKGILHNWSDDDARAILANCRRAMDARGRLLLVDWIVPTGNAPHPSKFLDLTMLFVYGGRERTEAEHAWLLAEAGLKLARVIGPPSMLNVLEVIPA
ncbi:acetylserotonin O-methyltransferase [Kutzneria buriramensis]|uniref:Methyltransferase family protein n=1 Tax=Kutzneria buriramensis TaxID=1045776 RepID=A0A3E0H5Y2_9PSEU|nr:acetylserotonin O-methyltransferase [Kutzneria buriramensis]REH38020.1 methyltransferase family protein [Kutzneria buriramensis]